MVTEQQEKQSELEKLELWELRNQEQIEHGR